MLLLGGMRSDFGVILGTKIRVGVTWTEVLCMCAEGIAHRF